MQKLIDSFNNSSYSQLTEILQESPQECIPFCEWLIKKLELGEEKNKDWSSVIIAISNAMHSQLIEEQKSGKTPDELVKKLINQVFPPKESSLIESRIQNIQEKVFSFPTNTEIEKMIRSTLSHGLKSSAYCLCERMDPPFAYYFAKENEMDERFIKQLVEKIEPRTRELIDKALHINKYGQPINDFLYSHSFSDLMVIAPYLINVIYYDDDYDENEVKNQTQLSEEKIHQFLSSCSRLETLLIKSKAIQSLPKLPTCKQLICRDCLNLKQLSDDLFQCQELNCSGCKQLIQLPELPNCQKLDCWDCEQLTQLPELPSCQKLYCSGCKQLTQLPANLPNCQELICWGCKQLTQLPELPNCQKLNCSGCKQLTQLPELPNCQELNCGSCKQLSQLPANLPNCQKLDCHCCEQLTQLPELPNCKKLNCHCCEQLTQLPELPNCKKLKCSDCLQLVELPDLMNCQKLNCIGCPDLQLRNLNPNCIVNGKDVDLWQFKVKISDLEKRPETILIHLGKYLKNVRFPEIIFLEEDGKPSEGVDAGGLSCQLVNLLFKNLFNQEERVNKLPFVSTLNGKYPQLFKSEKGEKELPYNSNSLKCYRSMGMLFAFAYTYGLLIGNHFNHSLFTAITALSKEELNTINYPISWQNLSPSIRNKLFFALQDPPQSFSLVKAVMILSKNIPEQKEIKNEEMLFFTLDNVLFTIEDLNVFRFVTLILENQLITPKDQEIKNEKTMEEEKLIHKEWQQLLYFFQEVGVQEETLTQFIHDYSSDHNSFKPLQDKIDEAICRLIEDHPTLPGIFPAIVTIAKEMSRLLDDSTWEEKIRLPGSKELQDQIEGQLTPQFIIDQLHWEGESEEMKQFLTTWIKEKETDLDELKNELNKNLKEKNLTLNEQELEQLAKRLQEENLKILGKFLTILTGSSSLTQNITLTIHLFQPDNPEQIPSCHSCNKLLELPIYQDKETFDAKFQLFLDNALSGSGFQNR